MTNHRKRYDTTLKAGVLLESLKNAKAIAELAREYGVHPSIDHPVAVRCIGSRLAGFIAYIFLGMRIPKVTMN